VLFPDQVALCLGHDDLYVRRQARDYFRHCGDAGPVTADDAWVAIDQLGDHVNDGYRWDNPFAVLDDLPQTDASVRRLVDAMNDRPAGESAYYLQRAARRFEAALVERNRDLLLGCDRFDDATLALFQRRLELAAVTAEAAWDQLMAYCAAAGNKDISQINLGEADALIEAVARHIDVLGPRAVALLADPSIEDYREHFAVHVVGRARYAPATDVLFAKLEIDADLLPVDAGAALARIGGDEIIDRLATYRTHKAWATQSIAGESLAHFKRPAAEAALVGFVRSATDDDLRGFQIHSLCDLASLAGLDAGRELILADPRHPESIGICECLLAVAIMNGVALPEETEWRARVQKHHAEVAERERQLEKGGLQAFANRMMQLSPDFTQLDNVGSEDDGFDESLPPRPLPGQYDPYARIEPIRNATPKVGRNDPCPCGSGKKHKKCCGAGK
jgi:hypothetical protein